MTPPVVLITGSNGSLGLGMAEAFLADAPQAAFVWLGVHQRRERADILAARHPDRARVIPLDVTQPAAWQHAVDTILAASGRLDVLVNNAGGHADTLLATMPRETWSQILSANLDSVFHGCQAVLPEMIARKYGRIINIASLSALLPPAGQANYAAAKAGVVALTRSLAKEVARIRITVNAVCPGYIASEALEGIPAEEQAALRARIPMRRFGTPAEVAALVQFLACPAASYITGSVMTIDGGIH